MKGGGGGYETTCLSALAGGPQMARLSVTSRLGTGRWDCAQLSARRPWLTRRSEKVRGSDESWDPLAPLSTATSDQPASRKAETTHESRIRLAPLSAGASDGRGLW
jgi:hypothetical protein